MICAWLITSGRFRTAREALKKFANRRTNFEKGHELQGFKD